MDHCNGPVSWGHYVYVHRIHEWERLPGLGEKDDTEENMELTLVWIGL